MTDSGCSDRLAHQAKNRRIAAGLALAGILLPGLHKFYLGQVRWGVVYLLLSWTPIPRVASVLEGLWYLFQDREEFDRCFNPLQAQPENRASSTAASASLIADALRQIEALRQDGLISDYEFEQKRRQLVKRI
jgi:TM2 domain-containing membrane protein YozV